MYHGSEHPFIHGGAGSGKSHLIKRLKEKQKGEEMVAFPQSYDRYKGTLGNPGWAPRGSPEKITNSLPHKENSMVFKYSDTH
jgi:hypothetical protein